MPNNRQWAFIFWIVVLLVLAFSLRDTRSVISDVLKAAASPKLLFPIVVLVGWVAVLAYLGAQVGLWDSDRVTDTVMWFITVGLVLFGNSGHASSERHFFRRKAFAALEFSAFLEVLSEVFVLNVFAECALQFVLALLGGMSVVASRQREHRQVKKLVELTLASVSVGLLLYVVISLVDNWGAIDKGDLSREFALPVWLTAGTLPYIYVVGLWAAYEAVFFRIGWKSEAGWLERTRSKLVLLSSFHVKARDVGAFCDPWQSKLASAASLRDGKRVVGDFRRAQRDAVREATEAQERLVLYAGVDGVDDAGRRLDRREFEATIDTLRLLAECQEGWYNNEGTRYRLEFLDIFVAAFAAERLPDPPGIEMRVSKSGQKWYAWRRTVSGWVFAIGAAGPPPDLWEYDGADPPSGFPGDDAAWGLRPMGGVANRNW